MNLHYHPHFLHQLHFQQAYSFIKATDNNNDGLALIPSNKVFTQISYFIKKSKNIEKISLEHAYHFAKKDIASYEIQTENYQLFDLFIEWEIKNYLSGSLGLKNILDTKYIPHLSSLKRFGVSNPGRSLYFKINIKF